MSRADKLREKILSGKSDANIRFSELCKFVETLGFSSHHTAASHHIFAHPRVVEIINLQDDGAGKAKKYQVKQIRALVEKYSL